MFCRRIDARSLVISAVSKRSLDINLIHRTYETAEILQLNMYYGGPFENQHC